MAGYLPEFSAWVDGLGVWGPVVFVLGYTVATVAFIPGSLLTLAGGAIFGLAEGTALVFAGASLGATAAFLASRYMVRGAIERRVAAEPRFAAIDRAVGREGFKIVLLLRLTPVVPFVLLNYALGLTRVKLRDYVLAFSGMLPATLLYVYYGKVVGDLAEIAAGGGGGAGLGNLDLHGRRAGRHDRGDHGRHPHRPPGAQGRGGRMTRPELLAEDTHDRALIDRVAPADWTNPEPSGRYHLVVIGAGTGPAW